MKKIAIVTLALAMVAGPALAQVKGAVGAQAGAASQSGSTAASRSGAQSGAYNEGSRSGAAVSQNFEASEIPAETQHQSYQKYGGSYSIRNVPNVIAPSLTTTLTETCMGSTSIGGAGVGFGVSFGTTWRDTACVRRLDARQLLALGHSDTATELMCDSEAVRAAFRRVGRPCAEDGGPVVVPLPAATSSEYGMTRVASRSTPAKTTTRSRNENMFMSGW